MEKNYFDSVLFKSPVNYEKNLLNQIEQLKNQVHLLTKNLDLESSNEDEYLTQEQACKLLNRNPTTLWRYRKSKTLKYYRLAGVGIRYKKGDVINLLKTIGYD